MKTEPQSFLVDATNPANWAYMASALQKAASLMDWTLKKDITDWRYVPIYRMLMGFALENLLKAILIAEGKPAIVDGELNKRLSSHGLRAYADQIKGLTITRQEKKVLAALEPYVRWAGRYPVPRTPRGSVTIGHSKAMRDAELTLGQKLYDYLSVRIPDIEPDHFMLPSIEG